MTPASAACGSDFAIVRLAERPDLLPVLAGWLWQEWWQQRGLSLEETQAAFAECTAEVGPPQTIVLLKDDLPIGTVTLARHDLDVRPALTPWLAAVFVIPGQRGHRHVDRLLAAFDAACQQGAIETAWLYTNTAERVYLRAGWKFVEIVERSGKEPVTLMRRDYSISVDAPAANDRA